MSSFSWLTSGSGGECGSGSILEYFDIFGVRIDMGVKMVFVGATFYCDTDPVVINLCKS